MKIIARDEKNNILRFDRGEEVMQGVREFCISEGIAAGYFFVIGAAEKATVSFYNLYTKEYQDTILEGPLEITGVTGNVAKKENEIVFHAHGMFSDAYLNVKGGHIKEIIVSATCEVVFTVLNVTIGRSYDKITGLNLMS